ncbi:MAG TPA: DUF1015 domain-containing protein [Candidatus Omnitrophota bacterium]|nr:DUF1015 domain-containing protein [Candidatus Omnitrophota bacterium]HPS37749.1 DUF1015 domain-containing protein [Candidatus Omnitrophota bacterium]
MTHCATDTVLDFQPLKAWHYDPRKIDVSLVLAPPYDVISPEKQQKLYERSPQNCVRLVLNKKEASDNEQQNTYTRARDFFNEWCKQGFLTKEKEPAFYVYTQDFKDPLTGIAKRRMALLGRVKLEPFEKGIIVPHEKTLSGPKVDRMKVLKTTQTNFSPVFGLYKDENLAIHKLLVDPKTSVPVFAATDDDGIKHSLLVIRDAGVIAKIHEGLKSKKVYIADGHHRYETNLEYSRLKRQELLAAPPGAYPSDYGYMALVSFQDPGFIVLPTHRILLDVGMSDAEILKRLEGFFKVEKATLRDIEAMVLSRATEPMTFGLTLKSGGTFLLKLLDKAQARQKVAQEKPEVWFDLNVNMLGHLIFAKLLDLPETKWESVLRFDHTVDGTMDVMKKQNAQAAFFLQAPEVGMLEKMGAVNERMPQKSTYFYPKLASGLVFYSHKD